MAKTRRNLVDKALFLLGIGSVGQAATSDDFNAVDGEVEPFTAQLYGRHGIYVQDIEAIEDGWFLPLATMLAARLIDDFAMGPEEASRLELRAATARADLLAIVANKPTYQTLRTDYFLMVAILFPKQSAPGPYAQESAGRLVNAWSGEIQEGAGSVNIIRRVPGMSAFAETGQRGPRGFQRVGNDLYGAYDGAVVKVTTAGVVSYIGVLDGSEPVDWAVNNRTPVPQLVVVSENGAYVVGDGVTPYPDGDLPQPVSVCGLDGYFIFAIRDGRMFASGLNDTSINSLDYARAEARQGGILRVVAFQGQLYAFKGTSCEVWSNTANPTGFPLSRAAVIDRGLIASRALAGVQEGFATALIWVGDDGAVNTLNGYQARPISTPDVERSISSLTDKSTLRAHVYTFDGQPIWSLSCPKWTWEYNLRTGLWHEREDSTSVRWRGSETVYFNGKWLCGDLLSSSLMEISPSSYSDAGDELAAEIESIQMGSFPRSFRVGKTQFDCSFGVGRAPGQVPVETDPKVLVSWSDDAGLNWSMPVECALGAQGEGRQQIVLPRRLGRTGPKGRRWRVRVTDPVYFGLYGADMEVLQGA